MIRSIDGVDWHVISDRVVEIVTLPAVSQPEFEIVVPLTDDLYVQYAPGECDLPAGWTDYHQRVSKLPKRTIFVFQATGTADNITDWICHSATEYGVGSDKPTQSLMLFAIRALFGKEASLRGQEVIVKGQVVARVEISYSCSAVGSPVKITLDLVT